MDLTILRSKLNEYPVLNEFRKKLFSVFFTEIILDFEVINIKNMDFII